MNERRAALRARLQESRAQILAIAYAIKGDEHRGCGDDQHPQRGGAPGHFPRSRLMRALFGRQSRLLFGAAAVAFTALRPKLVWRAALLAPRLAPALRPVLTRYLLPRLLGQR